MDAVSRVGPNVRIVLGSHADQDLIIEGVSEAELTFQVSNLDDLGLTQAIVTGLKLYKKKTGKRALYFHATGTGTYMDESSGELKECYDIWDDTDKHRLRTAVSIDAPHRIVDMEAIKAHEENTADVYIICPPTIYGVGIGPVRRTSVQIPHIMRVFLNNKEAAFVGREDSQNTQRDGFDNFYFTGAGEHAWGPVVQEIARAMYQRGLLKTPATKSVPIEYDRILSYASGSTSRVKSTRLRALGWTPKEKNIMDTIDEDVDASLEMIKSNIKPNF
ncbi:unnamed protein product [Rhizoctonia solani]|uniref:NAD-dependent epimerase/dehydratase domain-containing protein n=1 Tax=Rhizoctonia solani TaxID=456999 RepID=A0A8H2Y3M8_9AGAM|nr:unnamed protein product [Rhizoctonia solani]